MLGKCPLFEVERVSIFKEFSCSAASEFLSIMYTSSDEKTRRSLSVENEKKIRRNQMLKNKNNNKTKQNKSKFMGKTMISKIGRAHV